VQGRKKREELLIIPPSSKAIMLKEKTFRPRRRDGKKRKRFKESTDRVFQIGLERKISRTQETKKTRGRKKRKGKVLAHWGKPHGSLLRGPQSRSPVSESKDYRNEKGGIMVSSMKGDLTSLVPSGENC